jgi:hypothetical protein
MAHTHNTLRSVNEAEVYPLGIHCIKTVMLKKLELSILDP